MARYLRNIDDGTVTVVSEDNDAAYVALLATLNGTNRPLYEALEFNHPAVQGVLSGSSIRFAEASLFLTAVGSAPSVRQRVPFPSQSGASPGHFDVSASIPAATYPADVVVNAGGIVANVVADPTDPISAQLIVTVYDEALDNVLQVTFFGSVAIGATSVAFDPATASVNPVAGADLTWDPVGSEVSSAAGGVYAITGYLFGGAD